MSRDIHITRPAPTAYRELTHAEFLAEAARLFGDDLRAAAFVCPSCGDVATIGDFIGAGAPDKAGQECIGRSLGALRDGYEGRGCDFAAYGLIPGPWKITFTDRADVRSFAFAAPAQPETRHDCPVSVCRINLPEHLLMCKKHWALVPLSTKRAVYAAYDNGAGLGTPELAAAQAEALAKVEHRLAREVTR